MNLTTKSGGGEESGLPARYSVAPALVFGQPVATQHEYPRIQEIASHVAHLLGVQVFPTEGKHPVRGHQWRATKARTTPGLQESEAWDKVSGYAIAALPDSDLYIIDSDGLKFLRQLLSQFPDILLRTPVVYSGDRRLAAEGHCHIFVALTLPQPLETSLSLKDGQAELASLRGHGTYVIGPGSCYLNLEQRYTSNNVSTILKLDAQQSAQLLALFGKLGFACEKPEAKAVYLQRGQADPQTTKEQIIAELRRRGYQQCGDWLNGPCVCRENHTHGDTHPSFGFNVVTGYGHCFLPGCKASHPATIAAALGIELLPQTPNPTLRASPGRPFAFTGELPVDKRVIEGQEMIRVELNIAAALFRRGCYQSARFYDLLCYHSRRHNGQHTYTTAELRALGKAFHLSRDQVFKAMAQLRKLGLLERPAKARYRRVSLAEVQKRLALGKEYAQVNLPVEAFTGAPSEYFRVVLLAIEHYLPAHLATETIAKAAGVSRRAIYNHEKALGVLRIPNTKRVDLATATDPSFIKVVDAKGKFVYCVAGPDKRLADDLAQQFEGKAWGWKRLPSTRTLPRL